MPSFKSIVTYLILINLLVFFVSTREGQSLYEVFSLYFIQNENFRAWQFVTSLFMHGGIFHLAFNMLALWMFGKALEETLGKQGFFIFYFASGIGAGLIYTLVNTYQFDTLYAEMIGSGFSSATIQELLDTGRYATNITAISEEKLTEFYTLYHTPTVGASGAIYGVLVAFAMLFPNSKLVFLFIPYPIAAKYFVPAIITVDLFSGITGFSIFGANIAHFAHVGGAVVGFLMMWYWRKRIVY